MVVAGGAGSAVAEAMAAVGVTVPMLNLGLPDRFPDHGDPATILRECGLDAHGIVEAVERRFSPPQLQAVANPAA